MSLELSIIMPCLNEEETLETCINKAQNFIDQHHISAEIIIADNGSTDTSLEIAKRLNAKIVNITTKGYGSAIKGGIESATGKYCIIGDADDSYDFLNLMPFLKELRHGAELVMGNRFKGGIEKGAMPFLHRYIGNPILSFIGRLFFKSKIGDFHCGLRGIAKTAYQKLDLVSTGMEFASEMVVKSELKELKIKEVPTTLSQDGRTRKPHLKTWSDGWRHLRFLLLYSPKWLFFYPGLFLILFGLISSILLTLHPIIINNITFDVHTLLYSVTIFTIGLQFCLFYVFANKYAIKLKLLPDNRINTLINKYFSLEKGILMGGLLIGSGIVTSIIIFKYWAIKEFGDLNPRDTLRWVIPAITTIATGFQIILMSFIMSLIEINDIKGRIPLQANEVSN